MTRKQLHAAAYRERQGAIGILQSCICTYPLEVESTSTGHSEFCPSHRMTLQREAAKEKAA